MPPSIVTVAFKLLIFLIFYNEAIFTFIHLFEGPEVRFTLILFFLCYPWVWSTVVGFVKASLILFRCLSNFIFFLEMLFLTERFSRQNDFLIDHIFS